MIRGDYYRSVLSYDIAAGHDPRSPIDDERSRRGVARGSQHPKTDLASASRQDLRATLWSAGLAEDALSWVTELLDDCKIEGITHESGVEEGENFVKNKVPKEGGMGQLYPPDNVRRSAFFVCPFFFSSDVNPS